jgi:hypothetical protein
MAPDEIERFGPEIVERTGDAHAPENITDQDQAFHGDRL